MAEKLSFGIGPLVGAVYHALSPRARLRTSPENVADVLAACATVDRPLGCALAMRVMQSEMYRELDAAERADCDELVRQNLEWFKRDSAAASSDAPCKAHHLIACVQCAAGVTGTLKENGRGV